MPDQQTPQERSPRRDLKEVSLEVEQWCEDMDASFDDDPDPPKIRGRPTIHKASFVTASAKEQLGPARRNLKTRRVQCSNLRRIKKFASSSI